MANGRMHTFFINVLITFASTDSRIVYFQVNFCLDAKCETKKKPPTTQQEEEKEISKIMNLIKRLQPLAQPCTTNIQAPGTHASSSELARQRVRSCRRLHWPQKMLIVGYGFFFFEFTGACAVVCVRVVK